MYKPAYNPIVIVLFLILMPFSSTDVKAQPKPCDPQFEIPKQMPGEVRFAAIGDTGTGKSAQRIFALKMYIFWLEKSKFDYLLFLGDNVYQFGDPNQIPEKLKDPYKMFRDRGVVIRGVIGNHDAFNTDGVKEQIAYFTNGEPDNGTATYYSFMNKETSVPLVEFFALDSNLLTSKSGKKKYTTNTNDQQLEWLKSSLKKSLAAWKVVFLHHPLYSSAKKHGIKQVNKDGTEKEIPESMTSVRRIERYLNENNVRLVIAGHDHVYERIELQGEKRNFHFTSGAGAKLRPKDFNRKQLPNYHGCGDANQLSFMLFSVKPDEIRFWSIGENGEPFDSGIIK